MISGQQNQSISCRYCNMRQYQNPAVTMRNRLVTWTEQSVVAVGCFSSNYVSFSARVLRLLTFSLWPEAFPVFFIIKYLSIVTTATRFVLYNVCSRMLGPVFFITKSHGQAMKCHIRNININLLHVLVFAK